MSLAVALVFILLVVLASGVIMTLISVYHKTYHQEALNEIGDFDDGWL